jgi:hypothetical protein
MDDYMYKDENGRRYRKPKTAYKGAQSADDASGWEEVKDAKSTDVLKSDLGYKASPQTTAPASPPPDDKDPMPPTSNLGAYAEWRKRQAARAAAQKKALGEK